jgi:hypothetical protein
MTSQLQAVNLVYEQLQKGKDVVLGTLPFGHIYVSSYGSRITVVTNQTGSHIVSVTCSWTKY